MVRAIVQSEKHIVQFPIATVIGGVIANNTVINALQGADPVNATQVDPGTIVKAVFLEFWLIAGAQNTSSFNLTVEKRTGNSPVMTAAQADALYNYGNKKNILYSSQGVLGEQNTNPVPILRQWIPIPKGKQRFGAGDTLMVNIKSISEDTQFCAIAVFKAYQ